MKRAIVLSGGGAKGGYQIGVWKALRKLKIDYSIVTGTSVGALNGVLMVQKDYHLAKKLWKNMNFKVVFDNETLERYNHCKTTMDLVQMFSENLIKKGGVKPSNLEKLLENYFRPKKFFQSPIDYGLSTYNVSDLQAVKLQKKDMNEDNILDFVIASSSCFPAFQMKKIGTCNYVDGGAFDYIPINLALDMGADEIIAIDLHAPGIKEKLQKKNVAITYIEPNNDIGSFLNFNKEDAKRAMRFGYFDTMKKFDFLEGKKYTFKKRTFPKMEKKLEKSLEDALLKIFDFKKEKSTLEEIIMLSSFKRTLSIKKHGNLKMYQEIMEYLADIFGLNETKIYNFFDFSFLIWRQVKTTEKLSEEHLKALLKEKKFASILNKKALVKYFYEEAMVCYLDDTYRKNFCKAALLFPKEALAGIYLYVLKKETWWLW